jgi:hypothetical protein
MPQHRRFACRAFDAIFWRPGTPSQARFVARHHVNRDPALQYNRARHYDPTPGRWVTLAQPLKDLRRGKVTVAVKDKQGNVSRIERTFSVGVSQAPSRCKGWSGCCTRLPCPRWPGRLE